MRRDPASKRALTDESLLDAALGVLRSGEPLSVLAVANAAGVSRGTVYRRYADRDALVAALVATGRLDVDPQSGPRERILDAVGELLARQALGEVTLEAVAAEAGVGVATVYRQFTDRRGLLQAFAAERSPRRLASSCPTGDFEADLLQITRESIAFVRQYRGLFLAVWANDPEATAIVASLQGGASVRGMTARLIARHHPDPRAILAYTGLMYGVALGGAGPADDDARFVVTTFLRGVSS